jgi:hypothetical protein
MQLVGSLVALSVQGSPVVHGTSTPFGYGASGVPSGSVVTNTVDSPTDITSTQRFLCLGWTATTNGSLSASGGTTQAVFTVLTDTVQTWLWTNQYYLTASMGPSGSLETAVTGWYTNGDAVTLTAVPEAGYRFSQWTGDLPAGVYTNNPLTVTMNQARTLAGYCVPQAPVTITWNGTGDWFSATNWTPVGVPGIQDTVRINSGLVTLSRTRRRWLRSTLAADSWFSRTRF